MTQRQLAEKCDEPGCLNIIIVIISIIITIIFSLKKFLNTPGSIDPRG